MLLRLPPRPSLAKLCVLPLLPRPADPDVSATVFAPSDAAISALLSGLKVTLDQLLEDSQLVNEVRRAGTRIPLGIPP